MAIIELTNDMTEQEERATQNSNNNYLLTDLANRIYPVGSIYLSVNSTNPSTLFGGTWTQLKDRFLLGAGDVYAGGATGGEATHSNTADENGPHTHSRRGSAVNQGGSGAAMALITNAIADITMYLPTDTSGSGAPHNNMPPYITCYMWKRTA